MYSGIDAAADLAVFVQNINNHAVEGLSVDDRALHVMITTGSTGSTHAEVTVTRREEIPGKIATAIIDKATEIGAARTGIKSTGGIYAYFIDTDA